jgi:hypothetical protein
VQRGGDLPRPVIVESATFNRRALRVPPGTRYVRVSENWSEGWVYTVNGGPPLPVIRAPDWSMLLDAGEPATEARVEMRYVPQRRRAGWLVSLAAVVLLLPGAVLSLRRPAGGTSGTYAKSRQP